MTQRMQEPSSDGDRALEAHRAQRRGLYNAFGTAWSSAFEIALAPLIVAAAGYGLDRWLGIFPALTTVFFVVGAVGAGVKLYYGYRHRMEIEEANRPWAPQHPDWAEDDKA
ncbi:MAG TPA: AtpZ/AtpI family protein [Acidimicrobiales bacterium]|nr:AtpZ/AtpI family protein [Acidimicrobiales bacterium]